MLLCCGWLLIPSAWGAEVNIRVAADKPAHAVSPRLYGIFFEDINFGGDGGLCAELIKNGSFEFPDPLMGWSKSGGGREGEMLIAGDSPAFSANPHYLRLSAAEPESGFAAENEGFRGIGVRQGEKYQFSVQARSVSNESAALRVLLLDGQGKVIASADLGGIDSAWGEHTAALTAKETAAKARLVLTPLTAGPIDLDMVSLCREKTWRNRPHGLRPDLVQKLADLQPAFLRFPGGCIVEGSELDRRYQWKTTIGDRAERQLIINRWNYEFAHRPTPDYFQSFGVGFFEFFQLAEDLGAEPLPILNCGMACQFNSGQLVPLDELGPYIQDALDLIEFANGPITSRWGAKRAALGHPEPFQMKLLGVGNEQWGPQYFERYELFAKALQERHPEIELVSGSGPFPADAHFNFAWPLLRKLQADIVDEHCYAMPDWFLRSATRYDDYDRHGPKVFMGEYAAQSIDICAPDNRNNLRCALTEAAFLTGIERNSDVVVMSSYAPLFGHEEAWQWRPNLIWFDNLTSYATPNYYVQQLFSQHRADQVLPLEIADSRSPRPAEGGIGVATNGASAEFKDLKVERSGEAVYEGAPAAVNQMTRFRGDWQVDGGTIRQVDEREAGRAHFGDPAWRNYTFSLKSRKLAGREGFGVIFRNSDGGSYIQWNLGSDGNRKHKLDAHLATHSTDNATIATADGMLDANRWYDLRVELDESRVRCYVDGQLVHDVDVPVPNLPRVYAVAGRDVDSGDVVLKLVNPTNDATEVAIDLAGLREVEATAKATVLTGRPDDVNSLEQPHQVTPRESIVDLAGPKFAHTLPPYSLTILRIGAK